jgi:hypothetical protein
MKPKVLATGAHCIAHTLRSIDSAPDILHGTESQGQLVIRLTQRQHPGFPRLLVLLGPLLENPKLHVKIVNNTPHTLLLTPPLIRLRQITPQRKPMRDTREYLQTVRLLGCYQDVESLVSGLCVEREVVLGAGEVEGTSDFFEMLFLQECWVCEGSDFARW